MSVVNNMAVRKYLKTVDSVNGEPSDLEPGQHCKDEGGRFWLRLPVLHEGFFIAQTNTGEEVRYREDQDHYFVVDARGSASIIGIDHTGGMVYSPIRGLNRTLEHYKALAFLSLLDGFHPYDPPRFRGLSMNPVT